MTRVSDDLGREVRLDHAPQRVVSLVPSLTETICRLGRTAALAGVTRHCTQPAAELAAVARVGGTKNPDLDRIVALKPDLVIVNVEENRKQDFEELERSGLKTFATFPHAVGQVPGLLRRLGELLDAAEAGAAAALELEAAIAAAQGMRPAVRKRVFCPIWKNPWMSFNRDTFADDVLELVGASNIFRAHGERYFEVALADVAARDPAVVLLPDEPYVFGAKDLPALAPLAGTEALRSQRVHFVDGKALFWFGTRTAAALRYLRAVIHGG